MFGSKAMLFAAIGSMFTRTPLTTSLNAMASGMKAINEGNAIQYKRSYDEWQKNSEYAFKTYDAQSKAYDKMLELAKTDFTSAMQGIQQIAKMTDDKAMMRAQELQGIEGVERLHIERDRLSLDTQQAQAKMIPAKIFNTALKQFKDQNHREPTAQEMGKMWLETQQMTNGSSLTPEALDSMVDRFIAGDKTAAQGFGYGTAGQLNRSMFQNRLAEKMSEQGKSPRDIMIAQAEFAGLMSKERALGTQEARVGTAVNELEMVIPLAKQASDAVARSKLVPWNKVQYAIKHGTSDPKLSRLVAATQTTINVYARATNPLGVARVSDKDHARDMLSEVDGPEAFDAVLDQMSKEAAAAGMSPGNIKEQTRASFLGTTPSKPKPNPEGDIYLPENEDDYNALPAGTHYRMPKDPPGTFRTKPGG